MLFRYGRSTQGNYSYDSQQMQRSGAQHQGSRHGTGGGAGQHSAASGGAGGGIVAPTTGHMRSGHIEVDSLYGSGDNKGLTVNAMNAPNNSTMQCGCENIDCPFCNQMMSIQMSDQQY